MTPVRAATWDDFETVLALIATRNRADYGEALVSADSLRRAWQAPALALGSDTWLVIEDDGQVAGYAELQRESDGDLMLWLYLADSRRGCEASAQVLALAAARAKAIAGRPAHLISRVAGDDDGTRRLYERAGYRCTRSFLVMEARLTANPPKVEWPSDVAVRTFRPGQDDQATYRADEEASEDKGYHTPMSFDEWAARMSLYQGTFDPALWFLACAGDEIAGVALNFVPPDGQAGWVDHLGVRRAWRRRGIGLALLLHSYHAFYARGIARARLSVDSGSSTGAPRLYERAGMRIVQQYRIYIREIS